MNVLFIHRPLFRIISPLCSGAFIYMLILLINNNVSQLKDFFIGQELYVCIGLAYLIQEIGRLTLSFFKYLKKPASLVLRIVFQLLLSVGVSVLIVSISMYCYYQLVLGFTPNASDLIIFNSIFSVFTLIYLVLYLSHYFLHKVNTEKLAQEQLMKEAIAQDFFQFKKGINPELLFESLESLLVLMKKDREQAETFIDHFSSVYRYILSKKTRELVSFDEEMNILNAFIQLFETLPYRSIKLTGQTSMHSFLVPGTLINTIEEIIRTTIASSDTSLTIAFEEDDRFIKMIYEPEEKLLNTLDLTKNTELKKIYAIYTTEAIHVEYRSNKRIINIPKLSLHASNHY